MRQLADLRKVKAVYRGMERNVRGLFYPSNASFGIIWQCLTILSLTISLICVFSRASHIWESEYWSHGSKLVLLEKRHNCDIHWLDLNKKSILIWGWRIQHPKSHWLLVFIKAMLMFCFGIACSFISYCLAPFVISLWCGFTFPLINKAQITAGPTHSK